QSATVEQLMQHRAGFPQGLSDEDEIYDYEDDESASDTERRARFVARALQAEPIGRIGEDFNYSNIGYAVAGHIAERLTGQSWEHLMRTEVFTPFGISSGEFGWPYSASKPHQPRGHSAEGDEFVPAPDDYTIGPDIAPAGDVQCTVSDLATYAWIHLQGFNGIDGPLLASTFRRLHTPLTPSTSGRGYACGWSLREVDGIGTVHDHNGSGGTYYAHMEIHPDSNFVIVVATNVGLEGMDIAQKIVDTVTSKYSN
ncbi:MAG: serine hydrolase, partial [Planctomycetota bacterium]|nr:serine hydrolase [Planctomycetota bacterium]